ncbi:unnamed protein product [Rotaria socialis]|uniref:Uncharacterized protein n=1 Tax=Rotaria socialis TaxID=392032 RepID=A0A818UHB1_9BILA|nr:unnamed protein product [Rotaria socialis]
MFSALALNTTYFKADRTDSSYGTGIVNTQIYTIVDYRGQQIYIYKSLSNDPKNLIYYYVPIMFPKKKLNTNWIWTSGRGELRLNVMFGNDEIEDKAWQEIGKTGETGTFKVVPLIIDSFSAFVGNADNKPVSGVHLFRRTHPNDKTMTIRFQCSSEVIAKEVMSSVVDGDYDVEFAFFFAGLNKVSISMDNSKQEKLDLNMYGQLWSSSDINPDRLTSELNKIFTYNQAETNYRNTRDNYYDFHEEYAKSLAMSAALEGSAIKLGTLLGSMDIYASLN